MRFKKAGGLTQSEKMLAELCDSSFLSLWSYPNLFRKPGKELCDLLVVFGDSVVIFSDKSCDYPKSGDPTLDWSRWYRRSVSNSACQIRRAEDWLKKFPERVFLDAKCTERLPIQIAHGARLRVYRVCIALGALHRAEEETGRPHLRVSADVEDGAERFTIGRVANANGLIHVFDEESLPIALAELSTTADFFEYLRKKEELFARGRFAFAESELDLLAYFLWNGREFPHRGAVRFHLDPNLWQQIEVSPEFLAGREENKVAWFWDGLAEYLTDRYLKVELEYGNEVNVEDYERVVRVMAAETRFSRRLLAKWILERADLAKDGYVGSLFPSLQEDVLYMLLIGPGDGGKNFAEYRKERSQQLYARCIAGKAVHTDRQIIVGIALDARGVKGSSEDFIFMDTYEWSEEVLQNAKKLRESLGYFVEGKAQIRRVEEAEYPGT